MTDLVERLRKMSSGAVELAREGEKTTLGAAIEIERLQARQELLEKVVEAASELQKTKGYSPPVSPHDFTPNWHLLKRALAALKAPATPECDHDWFTPEDSEAVKWGWYQMCSECHAIRGPATPESIVLTQHGDKK